MNRIGNKYKHIVSIMTVLVLMVSPALAVESTAPSASPGNQELSAVELANALAKEAATDGESAIVEPAEKIVPAAEKKVAPAKIETKTVVAETPGKIAAAEDKGKTVVAEAKSKVEAVKKSVNITKTKGSSSDAAPIEVASKPMPVKLPADFLPPAASGGVSSRSLLTYLSDWHHDGEVLRLSDANDKKSINIPVSSRQEVESIAVHIDFTNSISLSSGRSQLRFRFNGHIVGQAKLDPIFPSGGLDLKIPGRYVKKGDNDLFIESSLHTGERDSANYSSELWAEIDVKTSSVVIRTKTRTIEPTLAALPELIRGGVNQGYYPLMVRMGSESPTDALLNAAAVAVQGLAQYTGEVPLKVATSLSGSGAKANKPAVDKLLIGTFEQLSETLDAKRFSENDLSGETSQLIATYRDPTHKHCFVLVIAGKTLADVKQAAMRFATMDASVEIASTLVSSGLVSQKAIESEHSDNVQENMRYTFEQLGLPNAELHDVRDAAEVVVKMPADLFAISDEDVDLIVHFSYSAGLGSGSSISILLNGEFQQSIPLDSFSGLLIKDYKIKIPLRAFERGNNTIRLQGNIVPGQAAKEHEYMAKAINVTIFGDSIVRIPSLSHYVRMPDLDLLKRTGFPYIRGSEAQSELYLTRVDDVHVSAAVMMAAKISQIHERVVGELALTRELSSDAEQDIIVLGTTNEISEQYWSASSIRKDGGNFWFSPKDAFASEGVPHNPITTMIGFEHMIDAFTRSASEPATMQQLDMHQHGLVSQFESPFNEESTVTLVAAESLAEGVAQLVSPKVWDTLDKDTTIWDMGAEEVSFSHNYKLSDEYFTGELSLPGKIAYMSITSPLFLFGLVFALIVLLAWLTRAMVHHHRHKHHPGMAD